MTDIMMSSEWRAAGGAVPPEHSRTGRKPFRDECYRHTQSKAGEADTSVKRSCNSYRFTAQSPQIGDF